MGLIVVRVFFDFFLEVAGPKNSPHQTDGKEVSSSNTAFVVLTDLKVIFLLLCEGLWWVYIGTDRYGWEPWGLSAIRSHLDYPPQFRRI